MVVGSMSIDFDTDICMEPEIIKIQNAGSLTYEGSFKNEYDPIVRYLGGVYNEKTDLFIKSFRKS